LNHGPQVLEVEQEKPVVIGDPEYQVEDAALHIVEHEDAAEKQWAHLGDGSPDRVALLAEDIPEDHGVTFESETLEAQLIDALIDLGVFSSRERQPREVALHVRHEDRHAYGTELLGQGPQRYGLARSRCPCNETVAVGHLRYDCDVGLPLRDDEGCALHTCPVSFQSVFLKSSE